jgi:F1F0 ATPase subunit 2
MNDTLNFVLALLLGLLLGTIFFGGLWWTIQRGLSSERPGRWFFASWLLRTGLALAGFYWVARGSWERLLVCLGGFVLARLVVTRLTKALVKATPVAGEVSRAS